MGNDHAHYSPVKDDGYLAFLHHRIYEDRLARHPERHDRRFRDPPCHTRKNNAFAAPGGHRPGPGRLRPVFYYFFKVGGVEGGKRHAHHGFFLTDGKGKIPRVFPHPPAEQKIA